MPLPLAALLALPQADRAHLDALVSEAAVQRALTAEGLHVASFGFWAVRRRARRQDVLERILHQPKDWTWLALAPVPPHQLPVQEAELLARMAHGLHGVRYVQWAATEQAITFTACSLRTTVVRGTPILNPGPPRPEGVLPLPPGALLADLSRWASVPEQSLGAALIEAAYVERVAAGDHGAFTNVDVMALAGSTPVVIEVKRRARSEAHEADPLTMTTTQAGTLKQLKDAGCEVHTAVLVVPKGSTRQPEEALAQGTWRAGAPVIRPGWGDMHVDLLGVVPQPTLDELRRAQEDAVLGWAAPKPAPPAPVAPPAPPPRPAPVRSAVKRPTMPTLKGPRRLVSFTFEYEFLRVWAPAPVKLGGRVYPSPAAAFLAARTLDQGVRNILTEPMRPALAVRLAATVPVRPDWGQLCDEVAWSVLRAVYKGERGVRLVATLPMLLDDPEIWGPPMDGLQGVHGLQLLSRLRAELAGRQAQVTGSCCLQCRWAQPGPWAGFLACRHPEGTAGTLACVGQRACRGPGKTALVAVMTPGGPHFVSKQATHRP